VRVDVVIVGNGVAGYNCAGRLARAEAKALLVGPGLPFDRPPLTKSALADGEARPFGDAEKLRERGIDTLDGLVTNVDLDSRVVTVDTASEGTVDVSADAIVLAVGLAYLPPPVPGLEGAHVNATPEGLRRLVPALAGGSRRVAIVGGGLIGVETAATLAVAGHAVTVVDLVDRPLARFHDPLPDLALATLTELGVRFVGGVAIEGAELGEDNGAPSLIHTAEHGVIEADVVIAATGGRAARLPGLPDLETPIPVDGAMRVPGYDGVYAIGDCALPVHARYGRVPFPHWDAAIAMADVAAAKITGEEGCYDRLPFWWSDIGPLRVAEVGVGSLAVEWQEDAGMHLGRTAEGELVSALVVNDPRRVREARALLNDVQSRTKD
jgi:3-phenylpropionate/trans-cinnamate dioxygenase ferredoxin reductase subunit